MITFPKSTKKNFPYLVFLKILLLFLRRTIRYSTIVLLDPQNLRPSCFHFSSFSFLPLTPDASGRTATSWLLMWNSYLQKSKEKYYCRRNNVWWWFLKNLLAYVVFKRSPDWCFNIRLLSKQSVKSPNNRWQYFVDHFFQWQILICTTSVAIWRKYLPDFWKYFFIIFCAQPGSIWTKYTTTSRCPW